MDNMGAGGGEAGGEAAPVFGAETGGARDNYEAIFNGESEPTKAEEVAPASEEKRPGTNTKAPAASTNDDEQTKLQKLAEAEIAAFDDRLQGIQVQKNGEKLPKDYIATIEHEMQESRKDPHLATKKFSVARRITLEKMFDRKLGEKQV